MTLLELSRVQTLAQSQVQEHRKSLRVLENGEVSLQHTPFSTHIADLRAFLHAIWLLMMAYSVIGMKMVASKTQQGTQVMWAPWEDTLAYHDWVTRKAHAEIGTNGHIPTLGQLVAADRAHRLFVLDLVRNQNYPLGEALAVARLECAHEWSFQPVASGQIQYDMTGATSKIPASQSQEPTPLTQSTSMGGFRTKTERVSHGLSAKGTIDTEAGKTLCKKLNGPRGCKSPCVDSKHHACDVEVAVGRACGRTDHGRIGHVF